MIKTIAFTLTFVFISIASYSQSQKKFKLIDEDHGHVIPFANVIFNDIKNKGTATDIDGVFFVESTIKTMTISYVGYETKTYISHP